MTAEEIDTRANAIVDRAVRDAHFPLDRDEVARLRRALEDEVEALIDACRAYYREAPPS